MSAKNPAEAEPLAIDIDDASRLLRLSPRTVHKLTRNHELPHIRVGRRVLYTVAELREWLASRTVEARK